MNHFSTQNLVRDHIDSLVREATAEHLARRARAAGRESAPDPWRRWLGRRVRGLSFALDVASTRLDPTLDRPQRPDRAPLRA